MRRRRRLTVSALFFTAGRRPDVPNSTDLLPWFLRPRLVSLGYGRSRVQPAALSQADVLAGAALACLALGAGCERTQDDVPAVSQTAPVAASPAEIAAIAALEPMANELKKDAGGRVVEADFNDQGVSAEILPHLEALTVLRTLKLGGAKIDDQALAAIGRLGQLRSLQLTDCPITNAGLPKLATLGELLVLKLSGKNGATTVDDDGLKALADLKQLKSLALDYLWVSEAGLAQLPKDSLEEIYLSQTLISDEGCQVFQQFPKLRKLRLSRSQLTDEGLRVVGELPNLQDLDLSENSLISDAGLQHLASAVKLQRLNLWRAPITDQGVQHLAGLTEMQWLNLDNTRITDAALPSLREMQKLTFLHLGSTAVSDKGLPDLEQLVSLKELKVTRTAVTAEGVQQLKQKLPQTEIQLKYLD